ncbi:MAG: tripartite tricarboxylate transporter substrate binding protein [Aquisalimonadaceae bacterium]
MFRLTKYLIPQLCTGLCVLVLALPLSAADSFPNKPIRLIVPYPAGGATDQIARSMQQPMSEFLGQPIVIENQSGAGGTIGTNAVVQSDPDGYTLAFGNTGPNAVVSLLRDIPYDVVEDLQPISTAVILPMILAVPADSPATDLKSFMEFARNETRGLNYSSVGNGSLSHLTGEYFKNRTGFNMTHIAYRGGAPSMTALAGGEVDFAFITGLDGFAMREAGRLRYLAVAAPSAVESLPDLPLVSDEVPDFASSVWFGILAPSGVPHAVVEKLNAAVAHAAKSPEVRKLEERNVEVRADGPEAMGQIIADERKLWSEVIREGDIRM